MLVARRGESTYHPDIYQADRNTVGLCEITFVGDLRDDVPNEEQEKSNG
ncbi:hypothetical protein SAMN04488593_2881 [Microbacterium azadirachtae]|nr:hypothetical protein SAMN04488593_2881 [Microbacterium azadirachtae]SEG41171.1 hypothetical protein SAMN04488594_2866 [Microbacterium azadirachtae]SEG44146.1 hypothetical protein SAMN04488592_2875 [Microbacterium azadirachtae]